MKSYSRKIFANDQSNFGYLWPIVIFLGFTGLLSGNIILTIVALIPLPFLFKWFWRQNEPSIFLFAFLFQWISITIKVFYSNFQGKEFTTLHEFTENIQLAFLLNIYGLLFFGLGIYLVIKDIPVRIDEFKKELLKYDTKALIIIYLIFLFIINFMFKLRYVVPGLFQGVVALSQIKLGFIFLLFYISYYKKQYISIVWFIFLIEIASGFLSFFSNFKEIIIILFISYLAFRGNLKSKEIVVSFVIIFIGFYFGLLWTGIKGEYRFFLAGGERSQQVVVDKQAAADKFIQLVTSFDFDEDGEIALEALIDRVSYIDHFSASLGYVPAFVPHENGKVWGQAITHVVTPRLFFPNKPAIDDSQHLMKYTGMVVADASMGTSISLGYMGDSYVDFGPVFMVVPLFLLGLFIGYIYKNLFKTKKVIWAYVLIVPLYEFTYNLGVASIKMFTWLVMYLLVAWIFRKYVMNRIDDYIRIKS